MFSLTFRRFICRIPVKELAISYSSSSGPGGQALNRSSSKVLIKFHPETSKTLSSEEKGTLRDSMGSSAPLIFSSEKTRSQAKNLDDALRKLEARLKGILEPPLPVLPTPEELEKVEKAKEKANKRRIEQKRYKSLHKKQRQGIIY
eukprot:TRINITY_DN25474_c0_g1_i1.p1 TRINITY_DN25474_c0_g1~~TRINITY_DN25474_c0_g1_i1.p1  ORF type:complete len:146 (-),score=42.92 TRINITY_DN25474_c0_g1_i1:189-626(-)